MSIYRCEVVYVKQSDGQVMARYRLPKGRLSSFYGMGKDEDDARFILNLNQAKLEPQALANGYRFIDSEEFVVLADDLRTILRIATRNGKPKSKILRRIEAMMAGARSCGECHGSGRRKVRWSDPPRYVSCGDCSGHGYTAAIDAAKE